MVVIGIVEIEIVVETVETVTLVVVKPDNEEEVEEQARNDQHWQKINKPDCLETPMHELLSGLQRSCNLLEMSLVEQKMIQICLWERFLDLAFLVVILSYHTYHTFSYSLDQIISDR